MGAKFSLFDSDINTKPAVNDTISSTIPYLSKIYATDASVLTSRLRHNRKVFTMWEDTPNYQMYQASTEVGNNDNNFSETSPFITSEAYNQIGGNRDFSSSSSSSTSTSTSSSSLSDKKHKKSKKKSKGDSLDDSSSEKSVFQLGGNSEHTESTYRTRSHKNRQTTSAESSAVSAASDSNSNSYESSSAHTDNVSTNVTTVSAKYYRNRSAMSDSINTSDINIISVDS
jgi:hypothetical protein